MHMTAALPGSRMVLDRTSWTTSHPVIAQMGVETTLLPMWSTVSMTIDSLLSGGVFAGRKTLTNNSSLISGCDQGHEPPENGSCFHC